MRKTLSCIVSMGTIAVLAACLAQPAAAQDLVPAGIINGASSGPKQVVITQDEPAIRQYAEAIQQRFFKKAELIDDKEALKRTFAGATLIVYGTPEHAWLARLRERLPFRYEEGSVVLEGRRFTGKQLRVICAIRNPDDLQRRAVLYTAARADDLPDINGVFHGPTEWLVADGTRTLAAGGFIGGPLSKEQLNADLNELAAKIKNVHPAAIDAMPDELLTSFAEARRALTAPMRRDQFWLVLSRAMQPLHDAHSAPHSPLSGQIIQLPFVWLSEGMTVRADAGPLRKGDRIMKLGTQTEAQLLTLLRRIVPAENDHWVRRQGESLLRDLSFLRLMKIADRSPVPVTVEREGKEMELSLALADPTPGRGRGSPPFVRFAIDEKNGLGIFTIDQCINDEFYQKTLRSFFDAVHEKKIPHIAVDVRGNGGGNSNVIDEFLRYVDVAAYKKPGGVIRWSDEAKAKQKGVGLSASGVMRYQPGEVKNARVGDPFRGQLFVLTSKSTFSSGNWFALWVQDNKLGKIIGEPTGNSPSSYGDILTFSLPNSGLSYTLSYKKWQRPDPARDPADCITPDQIILVTRRDIIEGRDPVLEHLRKMR